MFGQIDLSWILIDVVFTLIRYHVYTSKSSLEQFDIISLLIPLLSTQSRFIIRHNHLNLLGILS